MEHQNVSQKPTQSAAKPQTGNGEGEEMYTEISASLPPLPQEASLVNEQEHTHLPPVPLSAFSINWSLERKTMVMLGLASLILVSLNLLFYRSFIKQKETSDRVNRSQQILQKLENIRSSVTDAETGQRGYLLTGQESYLEPYNRAVKAIASQISLLKTLMVADSGQQQQLSILEPLIAQKFAELRETIDLRKNRGFEAATQVVLTNQGKELMDQLHQVLQQMQSQEYEQLKTWLKAKQEEAQRVQLIFLFGIILNLVGFYLVYRAIQGEMRERRQAEMSFRKLNEELEARVLERTADLKEANANLLYSNQELEQFAYVASSCDRPESSRRDV